MVQKMVIIQFPHTSFTDYYIAKMVQMVYDIPVRFMMKAELFRFPLGPILRNLGGVPIHRDRKQNLVEQLVERFRSQSQFVLVITPEGTRGPTDNIKLGFYHIAQAADVPILMIKLNYLRKWIFFRDLFYTTGDIQKDIDTIAEYFKDGVGRFPENGFFSNGKTIKIDK